MTVIRIAHLWDIPSNYTGITEDYNGNRSWYLNGKSHREDGPAFEYITGLTFWYLDDKLYTEDEYKIAMVSRNSTLGKLIYKERMFTLGEENASED